MKTKSDISGTVNKETKPKKTGWGPVSAVSVTVGLYIISQILASILLVAYAAARHIQTCVNQGSYGPCKDTGWFTSTLPQFFYILFVEAITLLLLWWFLKRRQAKPADIALNRPKPNHILYALAAFGIYFSLYIVVVQIVHRLVPGINIEQKQELGFKTSVSGGYLGLIFISLVILPPLTEEILVRGFLYSGLRSKLPVIQAALITSILFAAAHLQIGSGNALLWIAAVDTFILSMVLVYLRERTGSLWPGIGVHMIKNCLAFIALFILKAV